MPVDGPTGTLTLAILGVKEAGALAFSAAQTTPGEVPLAEMLNVVPDRPSCAALSEAGGAERGTTDASDPLGSFRRGRFFALSVHGCAALPALVKPRTQPPNQ